MSRNSSLLGGLSGCSKSDFGMVIVAGRLQQLHDRKPPFRRSLSLRLSVVHSRCAVAWPISQVNLLRLSRKSFPHLQHRI